MQTEYLPQLTAAFAAIVLVVKAYAVPVGVYLALQIFASLVSLAFARKTQVETWVASHPRATFILRIVRAFGVDPWLLAKAWRGLAESRPPTGVPSWIVRVVRRARVALGLAAALVVLGLPSGCQALRDPSYWDVAEEACRVAMTLRQPVQDAAKARGLTASAWAAALCELPDLVEPFLVAPEGGEAADESAARAKAKGLVK